MTRRERCAVMVGILLTMRMPGSRDLEGQRARLVKIGALTESWGPSATIVGLRDGLQERGYRENQDFVIGVRFAQGSSSELPQAARDLVAHGVDVIVASGEGQAPRAAQMATGRIPIVFVGASDPVAAGLVTSIPRPGANLTGIADVDVELVPKRMELFRELVPRLRRILLVYDAGNAEAVRRLGAHRDAARRLGLTLVERPVRTEEEARAVIAGALKSEADGLFDPRLPMLNIPGLLMEHALQRGMPTMFCDSFFVDRTGLASYGANSYELGRQAARLVEEILKGAKPADLPVEQPTKFELVLNLRTAKALGLTISHSLLLRADRIIQ
jgi:putative tryptophan/tyrosine transport system substrate-binding protein